MTPFAFRADTSSPIFPYCFRFSRHICGAVPLGLFFLTSFPTPFPPIFFAPLFFVQEVFPFPYPGRGCLCQRVKNWSKIVSIQMRTLSAFSLCSLPVERSLFRDLFFLPSTHHLSPPHNRRKTHAFSWRFPPGKNSTVPTFRFLAQAVEEYGQRLFFSNSPSIFSPPSSASLGSFFHASSL